MATAQTRAQVITQHRFGGPEVLEVEEGPRPAPGPGEVLLRVHASAVDPADRLARSGTAPLFGDPPFTLGHDVSGEIEEVGAGVTRFRPGDEVFGRIDGGGHATHVTAPADHFAAKPAGLDHVHAAAAATAVLTAWRALVDLAHVGPGSRVLVRAAAGGAGHVAVQLAAAEGAYVVGVARAGDHGFLRDLGAGEAVDDRTGDLAEAVHGVDAALDPVGGDLAPGVLDTLRPDGILLATVPADLGLAPEEVEARGLRFALVPDAPSGELLERTAPLLAGRRVRVHVSATLPLSEAAAAHERAEEGSRGGIVLVPHP
ncbi:quinone oxidoreductase family protein [Streptomyces dubilierae]|uniref:NADP-dependent oxidoreductase n=1 Tax=Streptomyces dubilierae TaxID=3075533 RepID=A0ABU2PEZ5_9ACTN|nr:NADP-dependent oxidoreductase [Streptomyces sp. DSM 41921]MDT0390726.1 NADP-dependent oxidoreductase [Streptomyces sp. DSM 41921]